jgi:hypothetical protein
MLLYSGSQFLAWPKCDHTPGRDRYLLTGFGISPRTWRFIAKLKVAETRQPYRFTGFQRLTNLFKKTLDDLFGLTLVETEILE